MDAELKTFESGRTFQENKGPINCIDFHRSEDLLVTSGDDDSIHVYNTAAGQPVKTVLCKKYGVGCVAFTHHSNAIICGSKNNSWDETLRYLSVHDNRYIRYFKGHRDRVVSLCMSPKTDAFLSASLDKSIRLWDLRTSACQGMVQVQCSLQPCVAYDQQGLVFALSPDDGVLKLYDVRSYEKGPFDTFNTNPPNGSRTPNKFTSLQFSYDGRQIVATCPNQILLIDAYNGGVQHAFYLPEAYGNDSRHFFNATISPDDGYVLSGSPDSSVKVWNTNSKQEVASWAGFRGVPTCVKWAPRRKLVAVAQTDGTLSLMIPGQPQMSMAPPNSDPMTY